MRFAVLVVAIAMLAGCSGSSPPADMNSPASAEILKKDCADPHWREQNLGLWYSVCRKPLQW